MSYDAKNFALTLPKNADFSTKQFRVGKIVNNSGVAQVAVAGRGEGQFIIDDNGSVVNSATRCVFLGVVQAIAGASFNPGDSLISDANGAVIAAASSDNNIIGKAIDAGAAGSIGAILLNPIGLS